MDSPWDTAIDGEDNVWVANFGPLEQRTLLSQAGSQNFGESMLLPGHNVGDRNITADRLHSAFGR